jgi:hypothetical protein
MDWIKVNERLPEKSGTVVVYHDCYGLDTAYFNTIGNGFWINGRRENDDITHWMRIESPKEGG